jgi:hypothetical protein
MKGIDEVIKNLNKEIKGIEGRTRVGMTKVGLFVENKSMKECPVVTSNLKNSRYSEPFNTAKGPAVEIGFSASYAPFVHENPRAGKTGGLSPKGVVYKAPINPSGKRSTQSVFSTVGKWKFLEDPLKKNTRRILAIIKQNAKLKK